MNPLLLLPLLAAALVQPSAGCTDKQSCPNDGKDALSADDFRRLTYSALTNGLSRVPLKPDFATPYELLLTSSDAVPLAVNKNGQVLMAAGRFGKGKIVVLGHEQYTHDQTFKRLLLNAVTWLRPSAASTVGLSSRFTNLASLLQVAKQKVTVSDTWNASMEVFCMDTSVNTQAKDLVSFVESGGGLLISRDASALIGMDLVTKASINKIASVAGIYFTNEAAIVGKSLTFTDIPPQYRVHVSNLGDFNEDVATILSSVETVEFSWFSRPFIHGRLAFPVAYGKKTNTIIPAAYYGNGKVIVLTHPEQEKNAGFVRNAIKWLRGEQQGKIAINPSVSNLKILQKALSSDGLATVVTTLQGATDVDVYVTEDKSENEADLIHKFVAKGGGLLIAAEAFYWDRNNPKLDIIENYPVNKIINKFGISLTADWDWGPWKRTEATTQRAVPYDFRRYVAELQSTGKISVPQEHQEDFTKDALHLLKVKRSSTHQLNLLYFAMVKGLSISSLKPPTAANPVWDLSERLFWYLHAYAPSSMNIVAVNATATVASPWRSTGLYAEPGRAITIRVPKVAVGSNLEIQFGCQKDNLWTGKQNSLKRHPVLIPYKYPIENETFTLSSKFGGLIYVVVNSPVSLGNLEFVVENAENAPYYKDDITDPADWEKSIRSYPGPWAEIEAKNVILTMPSSFVRNLTIKTLTDTVRTWNSAMDAVAKLAGRSYLNPERILAETQINLGAMHSGYPIMSYDSRAAYMVDASRMISERFFWGFIHELGHNLQQSVWDFPYSKEVVNNLWPVYVGEEVFGVNRAIAWEDGWTPEYRFNVTRDYIKSSAKLENLTGDHATRNLNMYLYLQESFGWQPFMDLFAKYQSMLNLDLDSPGVLNLWVKMFSKQVNRNLVPYFQKLKWPVSAQVEKELSALPEWTSNPLKAVV